MAVDRKRPGSPGDPSSGKTKWRKAGVLIGSSLVLLFAIALFLYLRHGVDPDAGLAPEQRIRRDFQRSFDPKQSTLSRLSALRRNFKTLRGFPVEKRRAILVESLAEGVNRSLLDFTRLKPEQKPERAELLRKDAEKTLKFFRRFPKEKQRQALNMLANTPGGRAQLNRAIDTTTNDFSPEDRKLLGPTIKIWKSMLEDVR